MMLATQLISVNISLGDTGAIRVARDEDEKMSVTLKWHGAHITTSYEEWSAMAAMIDRAVALVEDSNG
jgi:hypothetical protein